VLLAGLLCCIGLCGAVAGEEARWLVAPLAADRARESARGMDAWLDWE
jgi:hypothetical protein